MSGSESATDRSSPRNSGCLLVLLKTNTGTSSTLSPALPAMCRAAARFASFTAHQAAISAVGLSTGA